MIYRGFYGTRSISLGKRIVVRWQVPHMLINVLIDGHLLSWSVVRDLDVFGCISALSRIQVVMSVSPAP